LLSQYAKATKGAGRTKWVNSPNVYQKVEVLETGTPDPKKITKWVQDGSPSHSTPVKVESPNQFVPLGTTKKEFKRVQQAMKEGRRAGGITAGPESEVLKGGASWEEAAEAVRAASAGGFAYGMGDGGGVDYKVGAASKGIIQRDYQHHATVFKSPYAKNPFDNISEEELAEYKRIIDSKNNRNEQGGDEVVNDVSTLENTTGEVTSPPVDPASVLSPTSPTTDTEHTTVGDHTFNGGEATDGNATFSEGEGDTSKATDTDLSAMSPKKEKKKKSGLRTPSFLKKKKKDKKKA